MLRNELKYSYKDVSIVPAILSSVQSRSECNPYYDGKMLPLFASPMDTVVGIENYDLWEQKGITAILPRTVPLDERIKFIEEGKWVALSLKEFEELFLENEKTRTKTPHVLIDVANGHMAEIYILIKEAKKVYPGMVVMAGNIANPETYRIAATCGVDFIRCGVGAGKGCFLEGTNITMANKETKFIENIEEGDKVITHLGKVKTVTSLKDFEYCDEIITINNEVSCTPNHKFLVINFSDLEKINDDNIMEFAYWVCASQLDKNKHTLVKFNNEVSM